MEFRFPTKIDAVPLDPRTEPESGVNDADSWTIPRVADFHVQVTVDAVTALFIHRGIRLSLAKNVILPLELPIKVAVIVVTVLKIVGDGDTARDVDDWDFEVVNDLLELIEELLKFVTSPMAVKPN